MIDFIASYWWLPFVGLIVSAFVWVLYVTTMAAGHAIKEMRERPKS